MISNNNIMDISFEEYSINKENTGLHSEDYFHFKENLFELDIKSSWEQMSFGIEENKNTQIFKTKVIKMIKKKRGRRPTNNNINKKEHTSGDFDNILRKIQVNFLNFIISIINEIIYSFLGNKLLCLCKFNYDQKKDVTFENVEALKNCSIKDLILKIKASPKYKKMRLINIKNNENINKYKFDNLCKYFWFNEIINKTFLDFFNIYYNEGKPLKGVLIGDKIINLKRTKNFYHLLKDTEEHKEKILEIIKTVYLDSFRKKDKMFLINKRDSLNV